VADSRQDLGAVAFNLHPATPAITALSPPRLGVERVDIDRQAGGHTVERHHQRLPVRLAGGQKPQHLRSILYEGSAYFRVDGTSCRRIAPVRRLASHIRMAGLLRDRYFEYATNQAWDLVTGRVVPADTHDDLDGAGRIPRSLIEVLEHGVDGSPRWIVSDTGAKDWHRAAQTIASEARRHGYVPLAVNVFLRRRLLLANELRTRAMVLLADLDAPFEQITLRHEARDRRVFADGALRAASWLRGKKGVFTMRDVLGFSEA